MEIASIMHCAGKKIRFKIDLIVWKFKALLDNEGEKYGLK